MPITLDAVTFDCANPTELAGFWAALLNQEVDAGGNQFFATVTRRAPERA